MHTISLDRAKQEFEAVVARVLADSAPTIVNTPDGESVVVVPLADYEAWQETTYLLRSPANATHLRTSIAEAEAGKVQQHELAEQTIRLVFTESAWHDYEWFLERDRKLVKRINSLIKDIKRSLFGGIGKPEALKASLSGCWSRRINEEHRLDYTAAGGDLIVVACRYHLCCVKCGRSTRPVDARS